jgi:hypothetical protein
MTNIFLKTYIKDARQGGQANGGKPRPRRPPGPDDPKRKVGIPNMYFKVTVRKLFITKSSGIQFIQTGSICHKK